MSRHENAIHTDLRRHDEHDAINHINSIIFHVRSKSRDVIFMIAVIVHKIDVAISASHQIH
jgi:hypothetical protein